MTASNGRAQTRIGIFRRIAVEHYTQPRELDIPEMLPSVSRVAVLAGIALLCAAITLLWS